MSLLLPLFQFHHHEPSPFPPPPTLPPLISSDLIYTRAGVLSALQQTSSLDQRQPDGDGDADASSGLDESSRRSRYAHDLLWGYVENKVRRRKEQPLVVAAKMGDLEREMVKMNLGEFAGEAQEVRRQHSLPLSRAFPLPLNSNSNSNPLTNTVLNFTPTLSRSRSTSTSTSRPPPAPLQPPTPTPTHHFSFPLPHSPFEQPLEVLILTQHGVLRGLASTRASEREHEYARELLKGYVENKMRRGNPPLAVSGKLGMLEREMLRAEMTQFAVDVQQIRLLLCMPPSRVFPSSSSSSSSPRSGSTSRSRRPPVFRAPATTDGTSGEGAPPAYESRDPNPSEVVEREVVLRGRMRELLGGEEGTVGGERMGEELPGAVLPSFEEVVGRRSGELDTQDEP